MMFGGMATLKDIKRDLSIKKNILWDIDPKQLMEPRCRITGEGKKENNIIQGYLFYIDKMTAKKPSLFLMLHTSGGYAETVAKIDEIPEELISEAVEENRTREYFGMYPINKKIQHWLKHEIGI
jgi:hypothetical protein